MSDFKKGLESGIIISFSFLLFVAMSKNNQTHKVLLDIQNNIKNIESDVYRMSEKGVECIGAVRCGVGFIDKIDQEVNCK